MRGRVKAVPLSLLVLLSLSFNAAADCNVSPRYSGQFRATVHDVSVDADFVWTATGYGAQLLQASAQGPVLLDAVALEGSTRVLAAGANGLAYAGSGSKIIVLRRSGTQIEIVRRVDAGAVINDILVTPTHLFVATRSGIAHFDLIDPTRPNRTSANLITSRPNVTSLAFARNTVYAADGDATVEMFNVSVPSLPQRTGSLDVLPRAGAVHATADGFVFVSDDFGQNTDVFSGTTRLSRVPYGATSFAATTLGAFFVAGNDRTVRAIELSDPSKPAELFERQLAPTGGTANAVFDLARSGNTLYVAAGDAGLLTLDITSLAPPFPLLSYGSGATTSALIIDGSTPKAYFATSGGTITETSLELATLRTSNAGSATTIHDSRGSDLLISNGSTASLFSFSGTTFQAAFRADVKQAVILTDTIVALLADGSVWTVRTTAGSTPTQVDVGGAFISYLARSASTYALAEGLDDGTTVIHIPSASKRFIVEGVVTGGLALNATHAAFFTFRGINLVDVNSGAVTVLPGSTGFIPRQFQFAGNDLLVLGDRNLAVWNVATRTLTRTHALPANAVGMHAASNRAAIATDEGMISLAYAAKLPDLVTEPAVNRYYSKVVTGRDRLYLFGDDGVDIFSTLPGLAPRFVTSVDEPGLIDIAATQEMLFTLAGDGAVTAYSHAGTRVASTFVTLGEDSRPDAIFTAGDAVWVTLSHGCQSGVCRKNTIVVDPASLNPVATIEGGVVDLSVSGTTAYAIFDLPGDLAAFDIRKPLQPTMTAHVTAPPNATSIALSGDTVYVLGDAGYLYTPGLVAKGEFLPAATTTTQQVIAAGDCPIVIGRSENPQLIGAAPLIEVPSPVRSMAVQGDRVYVLTEHSIEVWTRSTPAPATRRRSAR